MDNNLQLGIAAFRNGRRDEARKYLIAAMKDDPNNENVWGWLYQVAKDDNERTEALKKVIAINPNNAKARELLDQLNTSPLAATPSINNAPVQRQTAAPIQQKKPTNYLLLILVGLVSIFAVFCCLIALANSGGTATLTGSKAKYVVTGSASSAFITYTNEQGGTEQVDVNLPFTKELDAPFGTALSIVAQNGGTGSLTCEIWMNGEKVKTSTSTAQYGVVTCTDFSQ